MRSLNKPLSRALGESDLIGLPYDVKARPPLDTLGGWLGSLQLR